MKTKYSQDKIYPNFNVSIIWFLLKFLIFYCKWLLFVTFSNLLIAKVKKILKLWSWNSSKFIVWNSLDIFFCWSKSIRNMRRNLVSGWTHYRITKSSNNWTVFHQYFVAKDSKRNKTEKYVSIRYQSSFVWISIWTKPKIPK